ncbi:MAG: enoyl-CoA hydratase [Deinococcales bacterium]
MSTNTLAAQPILRQDQDGIATLTLNRPQAFNSLSEDTLAALQQELDNIATNPEIRVVVIAASGKAFSAGHDLKQMRANPREDYYQQLFNTCGKMMMTIHRLPQPVIAKVEGMATAAGCQLVAACDLAVAVDTATFATSGIRFGLFCSTPAVPLSRNLSRKHAMEMLLTGDFISAQEAQQKGLINQAVPADKVDETIQSYVESIISKSAVAVRMGKEMFYKQLELPLDEAYSYAASVMACNMMADDAQEGVNAFFEKRQPVWKHR